MESELRVGRGGGSDAEEERVGRKFFGGERLTLSAGGVPKINQRPPHFPAA